MKRLFLIFALLATVVSATDQNLGYVPNTETAVISSTVRLYAMVLSNTSGGAVTITMKDRTTNCGGSGCAFWPTVSIAANTFYEVDFHGLRVQNGFTWQASTASAVTGWISYGN